MEVYADEAQKREYVTSPITVANNDIEHFFSLMKGEKNLVCSYIKNVYMLLWCTKKALTKKYTLGET